MEGVSTVTIEGERFKTYVDFQTEGCWNWKLKPNAKGYGYYNYGARPGKHKRAHRLAWEIWKGPIPDGMTIDHLCRNRLCVRPSHLEIVSMNENRRRGLCGILKTHCVHGHEYTLKNTYRTPGKHDRRCRQCQQERYQLGLLQSK